ncbi:MAG: YXWGXW repeat-containing protein, partial [Terriglobales bacterium]
IPGKRGMMSKGNTTMHIRFIRTLLFAFVMLGMSAAAFARIGVVITVGPPALPIYEQPVCPGDGYLWTPGYWGWGDDFDDYYWVPGTWIMPPEVGFLWTPGYWGWGGDSFIFYDGYWGPQIGFYGGINYGFGYFGVGFDGGRWDNGHFFYNRAVANVNVDNIHNVYNTKVNNTAVNHVSYNGGNGGITSRPTAAEEAAAREKHVGPVAAQTQHMQQARSDPDQRASKNEGKPPVAATAKPGEFKGNDVVKASEAGGRYTPPANRGENQPRESGSAARPEGNATGSNPAGHVRDLPPIERPAAPNTGDAKLDKKYQKQQDKQYAQQQKERQKLQQQQEKEDQKLTKQNNDAQKQLVEQRHQQQTQQMQQRHQQQTQQMQQRMQAPAARPEGGGRPH